MRSSFFDAQSLPTGSSAEQKTAEAIAGTARTLFQPTFRTTDGMFVRADILERHDDGTWTLYEVKSSSKVKQDKKHNHIKDACFQIIALEKSGLRIRDVCILHVNPDYVRGAAIEPHLLLRKARVTDAVAAIQKETEDEVTRALTLLAQRISMKRVAPVSLRQETIIAMRSGILMPCRLSARSGKLSVYAKRSSGRFLSGMCSGLPMCRMTLS